MMENSTDKTSAAGFILVLIIFLASVLVYFAQASGGKKYEGTYPVIKPLAKGSFAFYPDRAEIRISGAPLPVKRIAVFAYDEKGRQVCVLKPVYDGLVVVTARDMPDFRVRFRNGKEDGYEMLSGGRLQNQTGFLEILTRSRDSGRRYGVQECLYPVCQRCLEVCVVRKSFVLEMAVESDGTLYPVFKSEGCPRCGKCIAACSQRVICRSRDLPAQVLPGSGKDAPVTEPLSGKKLEKALEQITY